MSGLPDTPWLFRWRKALMSSDGPSAAMRFVLLALSTHGDTDGDNIFPSTRTLATETGLSRRWVEEQLRKADGEGWINRKNLGQGQGWRRMAYTLTIPERAEVGSPPSPDNVESTVPHLNDERGEPGTERGELHARRGELDGIDVGKTVPLTSSVNSSISSSENSAPASRAEKSQTDSFKELCAFVQECIGNKQPWNSRYQDALNEYIDAFGVEVLIGMLLGRNFHNVEYALKAWQELHTHEQSEYIQTCCRERYHEFKKAEVQDQLDHFPFGDVLDQLLQDREITESVERENLSYSGLAGQAHDYLARGKKITDFMQDHPNIPTEMKAEAWRTAMRERTSKSAGVRET